MKIKFSEFLLMYISEKTLIYELVTAIGLDNTLKLLTIFEGENVKFPSKRELDLDIQKLYIYSRLYENPDNKIILDELCLKYNLSTSEVLKKYEEIKKYVETSGILNYYNVDASSLSVSSPDEVILRLLG